MTSTKAKKNSSRKGKPAEYFVIEHSGGWHAQPRGIFKGNLFYNQSSNSYHAISFVRIDLLAKTPKGFRNSEDSPATLDGRMKSEFLGLAYMRLLSRMRVLKDQNQDLLKSNILSRFRSRAIIAAIKEMELESGKPISEKARDNAGALMNSDDAFKQWFQLRLHEIWEKENAANILERYAQWLRAIDRALSEPSDPDEAWFLRALEAAASKCGTVPTSKAVETAFNRHRSENLVGAGSTFRTIKNRLGFNWLPGSKPGPPARKRNRAGKSAT
jgi:hypothetical protein